MTSFTQVFLTLALGCGFAAFASRTAASEDVAAATAAHDEATLRDIVFIDADRGWAVGDLGTILKTDDGGLSWRGLPSGTSHPLDAIGMFNSQRGVAIGGGYQPHTQVGVGAMVWTDNGGETWHATQTESLPPLRHLVIAVGGRCLAAGDWSPRYQTSVFSSRNGGETWEPVLEITDEPVIGMAGSVDDAVLLTESGRLVRLRPDTPATSLALPQRGRVSIAAHDRFFWVDQADTAGASSPLASLDGGFTWEPGGGATWSTSPLKTVLFLNQRWTLTHASPLLHRGEGFSAAETTIPLGETPMRGLFRLDADRGWAVGDWGTISMTRDGGKTWRVVRGGKSRPAVMAVATSAADLPWSLLGIESLQNQRRVAVVTAHDEPMLRSGLSLVGPVAHYVWQRTSVVGPPFVGPPVNRGRISALASGGASPQEILAHTTPVVLVIDHGLAAAEKTAWTQAAVANGVKRVFETGKPNGQVLLNSAAMPKCGKLAGDVWHDAHMLLRPGVLAPDSLRLATRYDAINDSLSTDGLASFIGRDSRYVRPGTANASRRYVQILQARSGETGWIDSMIASNAPTEELLRQLEANLPRSAAENQQRLVWRAIIASKAAGKAELHRAMLGQAAQRWPDQPLGAISRLFVNAIDNSKEWESITGIRLAAEASPATARLRESVQWSPFQKIPSDLASQAFLKPSTTPDFDDAFGVSGPVRQVSALGNQPPQPARMADPLSQELARMAPKPAVGRSAADHRTVVATWVKDRPYLDGKLDEAIWKNGHTFPLRDGATATVYVAFDADFIYLGMRGPRLENSRYGRSAGADNAIVSATNQRIRDHDLDADDRYLIRLDVDGDFLTAYQLEFNANSQTRDTCDGFHQWQPTWFIALDNQSQESVAEIAIKKSDLVGPLQTPGQHWNLSVVRPGLGIPHSTFVLPHPEQWCQVQFD